MIDASVSLSDNAEVETMVRGNVTGVLRLRTSSGSVDLWSLGPSVWARLARACEALHEDQVAALTPPRRELQP